MTDLIIVIIVIGLVVIAAAAVYGPRLGVAAPLVLVLVGIGTSFLPFMPAITIEPEWILAGILPPLLYSSAVSMPSMNFRREFSAISGLSVVLVVASSLILGLFFAWVIPGLGLAWGIALGAIVSPTDAVATSIVKRVGASRRVIAILDGESLLNDATALVLLRTAIASAAAAFSFWGAVGSFAFSVVVAVIIGGLVGWLNLAVRARLTDATVNTVLSFTVPFLASLPAELLGASGLVAAVVAGLVTGHRAPRKLSPQARLSDSQNWSTVELVLEGVVFLTMGLELSAVVTNVQTSSDGIGPAIGIAAIALILTVLIRAGYVTPLLGSLSRRRDRGAALQPRFAALQKSLDDPDRDPEQLETFGRRGRGRVLRPQHVAHAATRLTRSLADIDYFLKAPLGWREGTIVVWAGMRGAVTLAAAQTLPASTPHRSLLILIAFAVAALSLLVQGSTIGPLLRWIKPAGEDPAVATEERARLRDLMASASALPAVEGQSRKEHLLAVVAAQRSVLLDARDDGTFDADVLESALQNLDADQIAIELRGGPQG